MKGLYRKARGGKLPRNFTGIDSPYDIRPEPGGLLERARRWADQGFACATLMVGTGMDDDDQAARLIEEVLEASSAAGIPLYVETHRATVTQDVWRTLQLVRRFPEIRFNGDFSHWYTGHDLPIGDFGAKLDALAPVLERTRYLHGRIGTSGSIQVDIGDGRNADEPPVSHFRVLWSRAFAGFLASAPDDPVPPPGRRHRLRAELLPAEFGSAPLQPGADGVPRETGDRWEQALVLTRIATECFASASADAVG